ncbi:MAG TPA: homoserine kinase, partial [Clostridia bacterium]|nr:homoserine kinase [Clostridia bacterium]
MIKIYVPATSANIGPGFDSFGISLSLYNEMHVTPQPRGLDFTVDNQVECQIPADEHNLFYMTLTDTLKVLGVKRQGFKIHMINRIPLARGLGSSASCIVGAILCANELAGKSMSRDDMITLAARFEGH